MFIDLTLTNCASCADMVLNTKKRNKLTELVARRKAALADAGTSAPAGPPLATAPTSLVPAPIEIRKKGGGGGHCLQRRGHLHKPRL